MKTRLQLQGELQKADKNAPRVYKNVGDVFVKTWKSEGIRGLQRGLVPAVSGLFFFFSWLVSVGPDTAEAGWITASERCAEI